MLVACSSYAPDIVLILGNDSGVPDAGEVDSGTPAVPDAGARRICPADGGWVSLAKLPGGARAETGVGEVNGEVYVVGGYDFIDDVVDTVEAYSYVTNTWRYTAPIPRVLNHPNVAGVNGKLYSLGGLNQSFLAVGDSYVYDPATNVWTTVEKMPTGTERGAAGVAVIGTKIYLVGGYRQGSVRDVSVYDTVANTWAALANLPAARDHLVAAALNGVVFAIGGRRNYVIDGRVDAFDVAGGTWSSKTAMLTPRAGMGIATAGSQAFIMGGEGAAGQPGRVFVQVEKYDLMSDQWSSLPNAPTARHGFGGAAIDGVVFFPGGAIVEGTGPTDVNEAFCP